MRLDGHAEPAVLAPLLPRVKSKKVLRIIFFILVLFSCITLFFALLSCSLDQIVVYSFPRNIVTTGTDGKSVLLIPQLSAVIGFDNSCIGQQCFRRKDVGVPSALRPADSFSSLPSEVQIAYIRVRNYFDIGYNFGAVCTTDMETVSQESLAKLALASQILSIVCLLFIVIASMYLLIQLQSYNSLYYSLDRVTPLLESATSFEELDQVVHRVLKESRLNLRSVTCLYVATVLNIIFTTFAMASFLSMLMRRGCPDGFCSSFTEDMNELGLAVGVEDLNFSCENGVSFSFSILIFVLSALFAIATIVVRIFISADEKRCHIHEFILHIVETREMKRAELELNPVEACNPLSSPASQATNSLPSFSSRETVPQIRVETPPRPTAVNWVENLSCVEKPVERTGSEERQCNVVPLGAVFESSVGDYVCPVTLTDATKKLFGTPHDGKTAAHHSYVSEGAFESKVSSKMFQLLLLEEEDRDEILQRAEVDLFRRIHQMGAEAVLPFTNASIVAWRNEVSSSHTPSNPLIADHFLSSSPSIQKSGSKLGSGRGPSQEGVGGAPNRDRRRQSQVIIDNP